MQDLSDWTGRERPSRVTLEGRFARIEPLDAARHAADLFAEARDQHDRHAYLFEYAPDDEAIFRTFLEEKSRSEDPLWFAIVDRQTGRAVGRYTLMRIDAPNGVIELGNIFYGPSMMQRAIATEAFYLAARYVFDTLGYRRFEWKCNDLNEPSKRAAIRYGLTFEGVFRQALVQKGQNRDTAWFSMLDQEWPDRRRAFERWLAPANFNSEGQQISRLEDLRTP